MSLTHAGFGIVLLGTSGLLFAGGCVSVRSSDPAVRQQAFAVLTSQDEFCAVAKSNPYIEMRRQALERVADEETLKVIAGRDGDPLQLEAIARVSSTKGLRGLLCTVSTEEAQMKLLERLRGTLQGQPDCQKRLFEISRGTYSPSLLTAIIDAMDKDALVAFGGPEMQQHLADVLQKQDSLPLRTPATKILTNNVVIVQMIIQAVNAGNDNLATWGVEQIAHNQDALADLFQRVKSQSVSAALLARLDAKTLRQPSVQQRLARMLEDVSDCELATILIGDVKDRKVFDRMKIQKNLMALICIPSASASFRRAARAVVVDPDVIVEALKPFAARDVDTVTLRWALTSLGDDGLYRDVALNAADRVIRVQAALCAEDEQVRIEIAEKSYDPAVRQAYADTTTSRRLLEALSGDADPDVQKSAREHLEKLTQPN